MKNAQAIAQDLQTALIGAGLVLAAAFPHRPVPWLTALALGGLLGFATGRAD